MIMATLARTEKAEKLGFHVAQVVCGIAGMLILVIGAGALRTLELSRAQSALAGALFISIVLQWAVLTVVVMLFLGPRRRSA